MFVRLASTSNNALPGLRSSIIDGTTTMWLTWTDNALYIELGKRFVYLPSVIHFDSAGWAVGSDTVLEFRYTKRLSSYLVYPWKVYNSAEFLVAISRFSFRFFRRIHRKRNFRETNLWDWRSRNIFPIYFWRNHAQHSSTFRRNPSDPGVLSYDKFDSKLNS